MEKSKLEEIFWRDGRWENSKNSIVYPKPIGYSEVASSKVEVKPKKDNPKGLTHFEMANEEKAVRAKIKQEKAALKATNKELRKGFEICSIPDCISIYGEVEGEWIGCSKCGVFWVCPKHENECPGLTVLMIVRHHELHCHRDPISAAKRLKLGEGDQYVTKPVDNEDDELKHKANEKKKKTTRKRK